ncbi:hypothetical protein D1AOALGA4SA_12397 [Olavius algarvensis Delta 1 endosymbiont]|nr:hypothetical protein D1AOALGA4SA_12397 [Olavius algarvensis Delta 1 endosymbiont]
MINIAFHDIRKNLTGYSGLMDLMSALAASEKTASLIG